MEDAFAALGLQQAQRNVLLAAKVDTVAGKQFEVARNRYISGIANDALYLAQGEKDAAVVANVQALRNCWTSYYLLRRITLYDFAKKVELTDDRRLTLVSRPFSWCPPGKRTTQPPL